MTTVAVVLITVVVMVPVAVAMHVPIAVAVLPFGVMVVLRVVVLGMDQHAERQGLVGVTVRVVVRVVMVRVARARHRPRAAQRRAP